MGAWPHSGRGGAVLPADLTVEHHGHDHPEDLQGRPENGERVSPAPSSGTTPEGGSGADQQDGDAEGDPQHHLQVALHPFHAPVDAVLQDTSHRSDTRGTRGRSPGGVLTAE